MGTLQYGIISQTVAISSEALSDRLKTVSINTLLGLSTVFAVLIVIILLIFCFKIIPYLQNKSSETTTGHSKDVDQVISQIVMQEEEELSSDKELVAVITAAICASMGNTVRANELIVRSIRKVGSRRK